MADSTASDSPNSAPTNLSFLSRAIGCSNLPGMSARVDWKPTWELPQIGCWDTRIGKMLNAGPRRPSSQGSNPSTGELAERAAEAAGPFGETASQASLQSQATTATVTDSRAPVVALAELRQQAENAQRRAQYLELLVQNQRSWIENATGRLQAYEMALPPSDETRAAPPQPPGSAEMPQSHQPQSVPAPPPRQSQEAPARPAETVPYEGVEPPAEAATLAEAETAAEPQEAEPAAEPQAAEPQEAEPAAEPQEAEQAAEPEEAEQAAEPEAAARAAEPSGQHQRAEPPMPAGPAAAPSAAVP
eukprot:2741650-Pyramimonas_sp.AAC.1